MNFHYTELSADTTRKLLSEIMRETHLVCGFHTLEESGDGANLLAECGYQSMVYVSIVPEVTLHSMHDVHRHTLKLDLREFPDGVHECPLAEHSVLEFYWETGGGFDSGKPHYYRCCGGCGRKTEPPSLLRGFGYLLNGLKVKPEPLPIRQGGRS